MNTRLQRIAREVLLLAYRFRDIQYDEVDGAWVHILDFDLPPGWNQASTGLLITLPPAYPLVPPNGWYMNQCLKTKSGRIPEHYFPEKGSHNPYGDKGWAWYCVHPHQRSWRPSANILEGDSLLTYVELIRAILTEIGQT